jgi:hypothetical protein
VAGEALEPKGTECRILALVHPHWGWKWRSLRWYLLMEQPQVFLYSIGTVVRSARPFSFIEVERPIFQQSFFGAKMATLKGYFFPRLIVDETSENQGSDLGITRSEGNSLSSLPPMKDDAMFQVMVLGTRGAGKTVFLASLFHLLGVQDRNGNNFILSCSDVKNQNQLRSTFQQISSPERDWPSGTTSSQEYIFDCEHIKDGQKIKLFKFRYFDFPGGFIAESNETDFGFILAQIEKSHSILVLLDGKKIRNLLENRDAPKGEPTIYDDLSTMGGILQKCVGKPLHFAITKSDILNLKANSLGRIKKKLLKHNAFRNIIEQRDGRPTYLLPVSAVGNGFAEFDPVTQQMKKRADGLVQPIHVDMSLTFTLVDHLTKIVLQNESPVVDDDMIVRDWLWKKILLVAPVVGLLAGPAVNYASQKFWGDVKVDYMLQAAISVVATLGLRSILKSCGTQIKEIIESIKADFDKTRRHFAERQVTLKMIVRRQVARADRFRAANPDAAFITEESQDQ